MPRYVAFLRGVSPQNARMSELKRSFEASGFTNVRTVLTSGNVVFDADSTEEDQLEHRSEQAMSAILGRSFFTVGRACSCLLYTSRGV